MRGNDQALLNILYVGQAGWKWSVLYSWCPFSLIGLCGFLILSVRQLLDRRLCRPRKKEDIWVGLDYFMWNLKRTGKSQNYFDMSNWDL